MPQVLVDTSVWIDHFRRPAEPLIALLLQERVIVHPFVLGELACGYLHPRDEIIRFIRKLPEAMRATDDEALQLLHSHRLYGTGLGWVDVHLLASARIARCALWSLDRPMVHAAHTLDLADL